MKKNPKYEEKEAVIISLGKYYQQDVLEHDLLVILYDGAPTKFEESEKYKFVLYIDRILEECSPYTAMIIRRTYLSKSETTWYVEDLSRSSYYRLKRRAVLEMYGLLD